MLIETIAFYGIFLLILFTFAECFKRKEIGLIGSLLLLILGVLILTSGVQIETGLLTSTTIGLV